MTEYLTKHGEADGKKRTEKVRRKELHLSLRYDTIRQAKHLLFQI